MSIHQEEGMRPRCRHLRTVSTFVPISKAIASGLGQSAMTFRTESSESSIPHLVGQSVLKHKVKMSCDCSALHGQTSWMAKQITATQYKREFFDRTREARESVGLKQEDMAVILEIEQGTYKQYETRTLMPHRHVEKFCAVTRTNMKWLFTGKGPRSADGQAPSKRRAPRQRQAEIHR